MVNRKRMQDQLILHEGLKLKPYPDTEGNWTVLIGYNITGRGVEFLEQVLGRKFRGPMSTWEFTKEDALKVLDADLDRLEKAVPMNFPFYTKLNEVRQRVVLDMAFNMGFKALGFVQTRKFVEDQNWSAAAMGLYRSKWARQVGDGPGGRLDRCDRLSRMLLTGQDYTA